MAPNLRPVPPLPRGAAWRALTILGFAGLVSVAQAAERILFSHLGPNQATVFVSNRDGSGETAVGGSGSLDYDPVWSPKGDRIVFTSERDGPANLYSMAPNGADIRRLTHVPCYCDQAAYSPDGLQLVYVSTQAAGYADLWILDLANGQSRPLTVGHGGDFRPSWSPDGRWIAFSSDRESDLRPAKGRWERLHQLAIYLVRPDGSGLKRLARVAGRALGSPHWAPDGGRLLAYSMTAEDTWTYRVGKNDGDTDLVWIDAATGAVSPVPAAPGVKLSPTVLPSGEIAWVRRRNASPGICYADGSKGPAGSDLYAPSWSADGSRVVYARLKRAPGGVLPQPYWCRNDKYRLFSTGALPSGDPSGGRYAVTELGARTCKLSVVEQGRIREILERPMPELLLAAQWSYDGKQIAFGIGKFTAFLDFDAGPRKATDRVNGGAQVGIVGADGSGLHLVTSGPNNNAFPSFSPDGQRLVYRTAGPEGDGLRIMRLADRSVKVLTDAYDNFPLWSPQGDRIAFVRNSDGYFDVMAINPDGTGLKQLTTTRGNDAHLAWSPAGDRIAFTSSRMGFKDESVYTNQPQPYGEIFVMNADGSNLEQLTDNQWEDGCPTWLAESPAHVARR